MKVKKHLPSLLTLANLFLGFLSILFIQRGLFDIGCYLILIASILDSLDGKLARKIGVASSFGKEIDSLADLISFCLAPSFLVFNLFYAFTPIETNEFLFLYFAIFSSLPVIMGAIRLARFNVDHDTEVQKDYFIGLPSPISALSICALILCKIQLNINSGILQNLDAIILPIIILLSFLMISKVHFYKSIIFFSVIKKSQIGQLFLLISICIIIIFSILNNYTQIVLLAFCLYYILSNILFYFINNSIKLNNLRDKLKKRRESHES